MDVKSDVDFTMCERTNLGVSTSSRGGIKSCFKLEIFRALLLLLESQIPHFSSSTERLMWKLLARRLWHAGHSILPYTVNCQDVLSLPNRSAQCCWSIRHLCRSKSHNRKFTSKQATCTWNEYVRLHYHSENNVGSWYGLLEETETNTPLLVAINCDILCGVENILAQRAIAFW